MPHFFYGRGVHVGVHSETVSLKKFLTINFLALFAGTFLLYSFVWSKLGGSAHAFFSHADSGILRTCALPAVIALPFLTAQYFVLSLPGKKCLFFLSILNCLLFILLKEAIEPGRLVFRLLREALFSTGLHGLSDDWSYFSYMISQICMYGGGLLALNLLASMKLKGETRASGMKKRITFISVHVLCLAVLGLLFSGRGVESDTGKIIGRLAALGQLFPKKKAFADSFCRANFALCPEGYLSLTVDERPYGPCGMKCVPEREVDAMIRAGKVKPSEAAEMMEIIKSLPENGPDLARQRVEELKEKVLLYCKKERRLPKTLLELTRPLQSLGGFPIVADKSFLLDPWGQEFEFRLNWMYEKRFRITSNGPNPGRTRRPWNGGRFEVEADCEL